MFLLKTRQKNYLTFTPGAIALIMQIATNLNNGKTMMTTQEDIQKELSPNNKSSFVATRYIQLSLELKREYMLNAHCLKTVMTSLASQLGCNYEDLAQETRKLAQEQVNAMSEAEINRQMQIVQASKDSEEDFYDSTR